LFDRDEEGVHIDVKDGAVGRGHAVRDFIPLGGAWLTIEPSALSLQPRLAVSSQPSAVSQILLADCQLTPSPQPAPRRGGLAGVVDRGPLTAPLLPGSPADAAFASGL